MNAIVYEEPYKLPAGILAVAVHAAFFSLLYFGFNWQTLPAATMSVELWQSLPGAGLPAQAEDTALPEVARQDAMETPQIKMDITLPDKPEEKPAEPKKPEKQVKPKKPEKPAQGVVAGGMTEGVLGGIAGGLSIADMAAQERTARAAAALLDEYKGKISNKIHRNIVMPPDVADNALAEFSVTLLPGGAVLSARLIKSSGNAAYDNAVERAIFKSQPLPLPADVSLFNKFRELRLVFKPVE